MNRDMKKLPQTKSLGDKVGSHCAVSVLKKKNFKYKTPYSPHRLLTIRLTILQKAKKTAHINF